MAALLDLGKRIPTLSLFSGAGGLDIGFHAAGFEILGAVEIEEAYCRTLHANVGEGNTYVLGPTIHCQDIRFFDPAPYIDRGIECIIGGPPCQTFSAAGRRSGGVLGTIDARGQLFRSYCRILQAIMPKVFVFENVYGLPGANGGGPWREIVEAFTELGYTLQHEVLDSADYGVPQHRERLFIVGYRSGSFTFPMPTHGPDAETGLPLVSVAEAISDLQDRDEPYQQTLGGLYGHLLPLVPEGLNYAFFTKEMGHPEPVFAWRSKFHDLLYKADPASPCRTIKAQPGKFTGPFHWKNRHFTVAELKRLQSFPDDYVLVGAYNKVVEQIGNSVPPKLAEVLACSVREQLFDHAEILSVSKRPAAFRSTFRQRQRERNLQFKQIATDAIARLYRQSGSNPAQQELAEERYYLSVRGFFQRHKYLAMPSFIEDDTTLYDVAIQQRQQHLGITVTSRIQQHEEACLRIDISGLKKYLDHIDTVAVEGYGTDATDLFALWGIIEGALISRSRFFTLIDIYGHYANRGDTVRITTELRSPSNSELAEAITFFGKSSNCGVFYASEVCNQLLDLAPGELDVLISTLRSLRIDIRTQRTHPTIPQGSVLCTYPFPLLSEKAHLERRLRLFEEDAERYDEVAV